MTQVHRYKSFDANELVDAAGNYVPNAVRMFDLAQRLHEASRLQAHDLMARHPRESA